MFCCSEIKITSSHAYWRADSRFAPSQWGTSLQSNTVFHWLGANLESALLFDDNVYTNISKHILAISYSLWIHGNQARCEYTFLWYHLQTSARSHNDKIMHLENNIHVILKLDCLYDWSSRLIIETHSVPESWRRHNMNTLSVLLAIVPRIYRSLRQCHFNSLRPSDAHMRQ